MHKIILQVPLPHGLPLYIALIPQSRALQGVVTLIGSVEPFATGIKMKSSDQEDI